jgi:hypothetical protein
MKNKLSQGSTKLSDELLIKLNKVKPEDLTWKDPLANRIIDDNSNIVKDLPYKQYNEFMKPANQMVSRLPDLIQQQCYQFITNYKKKEYTLPEKCTHNKEWKEKNETLKKITENILNVL